MERHLQCRSAFILYIILIVYMSLTNSLVDMRRKFVLNLSLLLLEYVTGSSIVDVKMLAIVGSLTTMRCSVHVVAVLKTLHSALGVVVKAVTRIAYGHLALNDHRFASKKTKETRNG